MATTEKPIKITVALDDKELYRAIKHAAIERDLTLREIVTEALQEWLEKQEEIEDLSAIAQAEGEETIPWEQVRSEMRAARETRHAG